MSSTEGALRVLKKTSGGSGSPCAADLANKSACSLSPLGIFFYCESLKGGLHPLDYIKIFFQLRIFFLAAFVKMPCDFLRIGLKYYPSYSHGFKISKP
jgi:hypothetical protein